VISVLLVDDEALVRAGLRMIVETADDMTVVGEAGDGRSALHAVALHQPDVVLMDIRMPGLDGLTATEALRERGHPPAVVVLTTFDTDDTVLRARRRERPGTCSKTPRHTSSCAACGSLRPATPCSRPG
jgi:DNA-binding NarL/FixJ family response regulator